MRLHTVRNFPATAMTALESESVSDIDRGLLWNANVWWTLGFSVSVLELIVCRAWHWLQHSTRSTLGTLMMETIDEIGHCAVVGLHYWVNSALWWTLYIAQAALFGWCFGLLLCFVWWFSFFRTFAALICSARFSLNSLWSPLATLAFCNFL